MNKAQLDQIIKSEIKKQLIHKVKHLSSESPMEETKVMPQEEALDFETALFHGGNKPQEAEGKNPITIKEAESQVAIKSYEVEDFEKSFSDFMSRIPSATYELLKQTNGYTVIAYKTSVGIEVKSGGVISMGDMGKLNFTYSLIDGLRVNAQNMQVTQDNKVILEALYNNFDSWQKTWRLKLSL